MTGSWSFSIILILQAPLGWQSRSWQPKQGYWSPGAWGDCVTLHTPGSSPCGYGSQTRNISCLEFPSWPALPTLAELCQHSPRPPQERLCAVRCSRDCSIGPWAAWTGCRVPCGGDVRRRTRAVISPPGEGGSPCPPLLQQGVCPPCPLPPAYTPVMAALQGQGRGASVYVGPWSPCSALPRDSAVSDGRPPPPPPTPSPQHFPPPWLGPSPPSSTSSSSSSLPPVLGERRREVLCRAASGATVPFKECMDGSRAMVVPADKMSCVVARDCQVSPWAAWAPSSPQSCGSQSAGQTEGRDATEERAREVLLFRVEGGSPCPHLRERRPTNRSAGCSLRFQWRLGGWGQCEVQGGSCGGGLSSRTLTCFDLEAARPAQPHLCLQGGGRSLEPLVKSCSLACREQCQVSAWASWSSCQAEGCYPGQPGPTKGVQTRTRSMVNRGESSSCPALGEVRSCSLESCYHWAVVGRGPCSLQAQDSGCGVGRRQLELECRLWDGSRAANSSLGCQGLQRPRERLECSVPCPYDCIVGDWSHWSSCPPPVCPTPHRPRLPLRQRNRTVLAAAGAGGRTCPR